MSVVITFGSSARVSLSRALGVWILGSVAFVFRTLLGFLTVFVVFVLKGL